MGTLLVAGGVVVAVVVVVAIEAVGAVGGVIGANGGVAVDVGPGAIGAIGTGVAAAQTLQRTHAHQTSSPTQDGQRSTAPSAQRAVGDDASPVQQRS